MDSIYRNRYIVLVSVVPFKSPIHEWWGFYQNKIQISQFTYLLAATTDSAAVFEGSASI